MMPRKLSQHLLQAVVYLYTRLTNDPTGRRESVQAGYLGMSLTMYLKPAALHRSTSDLCLGDGTTGTFVPVVQIHSGLLSSSESDSNYQPQRTQINLIYHSIYELRLLR